MSTNPPKKTGPSINRGTSKQDYATPPDFMEALKKRFGHIIFDLAASPENTKHCHYYTESDNALVQDWHQIHLNRIDNDSGFLFLNPPFNDIEPWAEKCVAEMKLGARILFLVPASVDSVWYWKHVAPYACVLALKQRICFDGKNGFPKGLILAVYAYGLKGFQPWDWKGKKAK